MNTEPSKHAIEAAEASAGLSYKGKAEAIQVAIDAAVAEAVLDLSLKLHASECNRLKDNEAMFARFDEMKVRAEKAEDAKRIQPFIDLAVVEAVAPYRRENIDLRAIVDDLRARSKKAERELAELRLNDKHRNQNLA